MGRTWLIFHSVYSASVEHNLELRYGLCHKCLRENAEDISRIPTKKLGAESKRVVISVMAFARITVSRVELLPHIFREKEKASFHERAGIDQKPKSRRNIKREQSLIRNESKNTSGTRT